MQICRNWIWLEPTHLKILHIIVGLNVGGAELMLKRLLDSAVQNKEVQHSVISLTDLGTLGPQLQSVGIPVQALGLKATYTLPAALVRLVRMLKASHPDIVQTWMYHADLMGGIAAKLAGVRRIIWGIRTTDVAAGGSRLTLLVRRACAALSHRMPTTIVCAAEASRLAHAKIGYARSRMVVVPNGFDFSLLKASHSERQVLRAQCSVEAGELVVGCLGRFHKAKDQENFVLAAKLVAASYPMVRFMMVGRGLDAGNADLAQWIAATGFAHRFVLLNERSDVAACLAAMDVFCLSSRTEGFPNVVAEAMAMGLPCVVTDVGDAALLLLGTGVVVPKESPAELARGISSLLAMTPEQRQSLGQRAGAHVRLEYSIDKTRERFEAIYRGLMNKEQR